MIVEVAEFKTRPEDAAAFSEAIGRAAATVLSNAAAPACADWRAIISPFFQQPPYVEHFEVVAAT